LRTIHKGPEPPSLTAHRQIRYSDYNNYADKDTLRRALVAEQRGLCCFCMGRTRSDHNSMKIEHWKSQEHYSELQLDYHNMLGACRGNEGQPYWLQHCDTKKGDRDIKWNPANPDHHIETRLFYEPDGSIRSNDEEFNKHLCDILKLNLEILRNNRKAIIDALLLWWQHEKRRFQGPVPRERFERQRNRWIEGDGDLKPYCQVAVWWIDERLKRLQA
jgi:uncharacterized protein (TIGR02646 family)